MQYLAGDRGSHSPARAPSAVHLEVVLLLRFKPKNDLQAQHKACRVEAKRRSPIVEISLLLAECVQHGLRTIAFCKTRKVCELVLSYTREVLKETAPDLVPRIAVYRHVCIDWTCFKGLQFEKRCMN
jgi:DEAD/DEAH box helicase domain-containing protein